MTKKGVYFMIGTTLFLLVFLTTFYIMSAKSENSADQSKNYRIQLLNDFLTDFENDAPRAMFVASFRSFIALEEEVFKTGAYYTDLESTFSEVFYNGTLNGTAANIMNDSSMYDYIQKVNIIANQLGMNIEYEVQSVSMEQNNPWTVDVTINGLINLTDDKGVANWLYNSSITSEIPIYDLRDPLYTIGANGKLPSPIKQWNTSIEFVNNTNNDTSQLQEFLNGTYYTESSNAPSFLMRFKGDINSSPYGIMSLVNLRILGDQGVDISSGRSVVDYIYFDTVPTTNRCDISGMIFEPNWFVIDQANENITEINELNWTTC